VGRVPRRSPGPHRGRSGPRGRARSVRAEGGGPLQSRVDHPQAPQGSPASITRASPRSPWAASRARSVRAEGLRAAFGAEAPPLSRPARAAMGRVPRRSPASALSASRCSGVSAAILAARALASASGAGPSSATSSVSTVAEPRRSPAKRRRDHPRRSPGPHQSRPGPRGRARSVRAEGGGPLQSRVDHQGLTAVALGRVPRPICEG
jgi:hypothetical protein